MQNPLYDKLLAPHLSSEHAFLILPDGRVLTYASFLRLAARQANALAAAGTLKASPMKRLVAATSVGLVEGNALLDLCYEEDSQAEVDMNVVMTEDGGLVETQATAERGSFSRTQMNALVDLAEAGLKEIFAAQRAVLGSSR